ncbi:MAG TPA: SPFH domain-containing protein, partial [Methylomirabilota bacterium]|nr:SPFH domain-containing protein [Methylomirabilota bacterium]
RHTLSTQNLPILTRLLSLPWGFTSPFRAEVYFVNLKVFTNMRWGTRDPVVFKDQQLGLIRLRAFGSFTMRVTQPLLFVNSLVGTQGSYTTDQIEDYLREVIVARLNDFLGETVESLLDLPKQYDEMAVAMKTRLAEEFRKYGTEMVDFYVNRITPPEDVERMIDERSSMGAVGDLDRFMQFKAAKAMGDAAQGHGGGGNGAAAGVGVGVGAGLGMMMPGMLARTLGAPATAPAAAPIVTCPGCQSAVAADSQFCPRCGRRLAATARCARCHAELTGGARFCSACGQAVPGS